MAKDQAKRRAVRVPSRRRTATRLVYLCKACLGKIRSERRDLNSRPLVPQTDGWMFPENSSFVWPLPIAWHSTPSLIRALLTIATVFVSGGDRVATQIGGTRAGRKTHEAYGGRARTGPQAFRGL